jgi:hypothetical protein
MAVKPEVIKYKNGFSVGGKVFRTRSATRVAQLDRAAHGAWFATVNIDLEFDLIDGRKVVVSKQVRVRGSQEGKLPHPDPFGHKKMRKLKRSAKLIG